MDVEEADSLNGTLEDEAVLPNVRIVEQSALEQQVIDEFNAAAKEKEREARHQALLKQLDFVNSRIQ